MSNIIYIYIKLYYLFILYIENTAFSVLCSIGFCCVASSQDFERKGSLDRDQVLGSLVAARTKVHEDN